MSAEREFRIASMWAAMDYVDLVIADRDEIARKLLRVERERDHYKFIAEHRGTLLRHLEPLLPEWLRDEVEHPQEEADECLV